MEVPSQKTTTENEFRLSTAKGFGNIILVFFLTLWVVAFTAANLVFRWTIEQSMYENGYGIADARWLVQVGYVLIVFIPLLAVFFSIKSQRIKLVLRLWMLGGLLAVLSVPAKVLYLTAQNQSNLLLTLSLSLLIAVGLLIPRKNNRKSSSLAKSHLSGSAVLAGVGLATPWALWGAFGSVLDLFIATLFGIVFGIFVVKFVFPYYFDLTQLPGAAISRWEYLFDGFVLAVFLFVCAGGLSQNGSQLLLALTMPASGWLIAAFAAAGRNRKDHGSLSVAILSALVLILPLAFFDADELALLISGTTTGEVFYLAQRAGLYSLVFLISLAIVTLFFFHLHEKINLNKRINRGLIALSILEFSFVYLFAGQPGFFGDRLFVVMEDQLPAANIAGESPEDRKTEIYAALTNFADRSQAPLREMLEKRHVEYTPYYLINGMEVNAGWFMKNTLTRFEGVDRVLESPRLRPLPQALEVSKGDVFVPNTGTMWNLEMINVPAVHTELGVTGEGIIIGQTDSGVDVTHPELAHNYRGSGGSNDYNWLDPWNGTVSPVDIGGHGTGTLGIIAGVTLGIAPDSEWFGCVNLARNLGNPALYLDCMQFMFAPYPQGGNAFQHGDVSKGAMIVNNSWGCPQVEGCDADLFEQTVSILKSAGIFMSVAAGNNGYYGCSTITDPLAIYADVFTTGAVDKLGNISAFSSLGPVIVDESGRAKPDLVAPGEQLLVHAPGGTYTFSSGTSFAAPHVSGVVALMWSANPDLIGDIETTMKILKETAQPYIGQQSGCGGEQYEAGAGLLDAYAAVQAALGLK